MKKFRKSVRWRGGEIRIEDSKGKAKIRISPFGHWDKNSKWQRRLPHYHRRKTDSKGQTIEGGGIKHHRPWERGF